MSRVNLSLGEKGNIPDALWRGKFYIALVLLVLIAFAFGVYYYSYSGALESRLDQKASDYDALNDNYAKLSDDHSALVNSNNDLSRRYDDVTGRFNRLTADNQNLTSTYNGLKSSYDNLNGTVNRIQETSGAVLALHYDFYEGGPSSNRRNYLEATVYNVGNKKADRIIIKGQILNATDNSTSISEQTFNNVDALDKRHVKWDYPTDRRVGSVWFET